MCGSEGTLAVMTELTLNLVPLPAHTALAVVHFDELFAALSAVSTILETDPSAVELLDHFGLTLAREVPQYARLMTGFIAGTPNCVLITEYSGDNPRELEQRIGALQDHLRRHGVTATVVPALDPALQTDVWTVRKVGLGLMMSIKGDYKPIPFIEDRRRAGRASGRVRDRHRAFLQRHRHARGLLRARLGRLHPHTAADQRQAGRGGGEAAGHLQLRAGAARPGSGAACPASTATAAPEAGRTSASSGRTCTGSISRSRAPSTRTASSTPATWWTRRR